MVEHVHDVFFCPGENVAIDGSFARDSETRATPASGSRWMCRKAQTSPRRVPVAIAQASIRQLNRGAAAQAVSLITLVSTRLVACRYVSLRQELPLAA